MAIPDRLYIDIRVRKIIEKMEETNYLNVSTLKNREIILYAIAKGIENPSTIEGKKDGFVNEKDFSTNDEALLYACVIPFVQNIDQITDKSFVYDFVQKCANTGFRVIEHEIEHHSIETIDKNLLVELDDNYKKIMF